MLHRKHNSGGFVFVEFAIALPLLILLGYGLALVGAKTFQVGKGQLADYVLEAEAQYAMERITHQARVAKEVEINNNDHTIKFVYHTVNDRDEVSRFTDAEQGKYSLHTVADVWETQYFIPPKDNITGIYTALNAKRQLQGPLGNPITGGNSFGGTKINDLRYDFDAAKKLLHITLEMESLDSGHKIKLSTAVFMPNLELDDEEEDS